MNIKLGETKKRLLTSEAYFIALRDAQAARVRFLRRLVVAGARYLKGRICYWAQKWNIRLCPLCC